MHHRVPSSAACELVITGKRHAACLTDISRGGARLKAVTDCPVGSNGELKVPSLALVAPCCVVTSTNDELRVSFTSAVDPLPDVRRLEHVG